MSVTGALVNVQLVTSIAVTAIAAWCVVTDVMTSGIVLLTLIHVCNT